jgi:cell wall-associated NlpC family hydrolase
MKNKNIKLAEITSKWINAQYTPYGTKPEDGCDCFSMFLDFLEYYQINIPEEWDGVTRTNYMDLWYSDREKAIETLIDFLNFYSIEKKPNEIKSGDLLICKLKRTNELFFTIYAGNDKILYVTNKYGVGVAPLRLIEIQKIFRGYH